MSTFEITQSLNWYKSNVMTMNKCGNLMAYGSRSIVVLVKGLEGKSVYDLQYNRLRLNTKICCGRIGAVSFSNQTETHEDAYYLASIDEVNIYIWNIKSMICEHIHSFGNKKNKNITLIDVAWLYECLTVVAMSDAGILHKWDIQALIMRNYILDVKISPLTLAACPHKKNLVAIGCKNGNIIIYDLTGDGRIIHKLHYHERNVVSLAWCPVPHNPLNSDTSSQPLLLASTACDRTGLYICRAGSDMYSETTVSLSMKPLRKTIFRNKTNLIWSCIKWINPTLIVITSAFGEIIKVQFQPGTTTSTVTLISDVHKDVIFSLACSSESAKPYLWSSCMGRKLIRTPLFDTDETNKLPLEVPTLGGFVYCFALSPVNSADFAIGLGDGRIYYWNVSNKRQLELITLTYSIESKVLSLAFHPQNEGLLAYGTGDGRVGIYNLTRKKNNVTLLKTVLAHPIYRLCWAPLPNTKDIDDSKLALYAVGNGQIIIYNDMNLWKDPLHFKEYVEFNEIEDKCLIPVKRIEMAWKPDYDVVAIGNSNGSIYLLDGATLKLKHAINGHDQSVECIIWHPKHVVCDYNEESKYKNYFASSSYSIRVHKLNEDGVPSLVVEFKGHTDKINELAWNPHQNLMLLSCSNDFTAKIWDVQKCTLIGVYSKHLCTVLCGMFSPLDSDIVFTGSADHSVHSWRMSKDLHKETIDFNKKQDIPNIVKEKIITKEMDNSKKENLDSNKDQTSRIQQFPLSSHDLFEGKYLEKSVDQFIDQNYENKSPEKDTETNYLAFFGTSNEIKCLLVNEYHALKKKSPNQVACMNNINIWGQNLEGYFKDAIETKTINDWMIAVAPSVNYELWTKMCDVYSSQLEDFGDITKASTYLVAIQKIKEAIVMLLRYNYFREALAIVKNQEKKDDSMILEITKKWAEYNVHHGHPKEAAHCYLSIGDVRNAITCLRKIKQIKELSLAAKLARYIDEDMEESLVINILKTEYFKQHKWNEARELLKNHPKLDYLNMWIGVQEIMFELHPKVTQNMIQNWICSNEKNSSIIDHILNNVECNYEYYEKLMSSVEPEFITDTTLLMPKITVFTAGQLCLIALQYQKHRIFTVDSQRRLIKCLAVAYNYETVYLDSRSKFNKLLSRLIMWIFPKGPNALDLFENFELTDDNLIKTIRAYLCHTCFSWLIPLYTSLNRKINLPVKMQTRMQAADELFILIRKFQQLLDTHIIDILNLETLDYFKAKKEIDRINKLLTTGSSMINNEDSINEKLKESNKYLEEIEDTNRSDSKIISEASDINVVSLNDDLNIACNISSNNKLCQFNKLVDLKKHTSSQNNEINNYQNKNTNKNHDSSIDIPDDEIHLCDTTDLYNPLVIKNENCKKEVNQFCDNIILEFEKFNDYFNVQIVQNVAHLGIEASRKKELEAIVTDFENKRINSPNPFVIVAELKAFIRDFNEL